MENQFSIFHFIFSQLHSVLAFEAFRRLFSEQHDYRRKDKLEVLDQARVGDIHEVHGELVVWSGVVFPVYLSITGESRFGLEAEPEFRELFFVFSRDLRPLRARANDGHIPFYDVCQLGKLVYSALSYKSSDAGYPAVIVAA